MDFLSRLLISILLVVFGVLSLKYNFKLVGFTGRQDWIESKLGSGTTYFFFKMLSLLMIISGILYITGLGDPIVRWLLSPLANMLSPAGE